MNLKKWYALGHLCSVLMQKVVLPLDRYIALLRPYIILLVMHFNKIFFTIAVSNLYNSWKKDLHMYMTFCWYLHVCRRRFLVDFLSTFYLFQTKWNYFSNRCWNYFLMYSITKFSSFQCMIFSLQFQPDECEPFINDL